MRSACALFLLIGLSVPAAAAEPAAYRAMSRNDFIAAVAEKAVERYELRRLGDDAAFSLHDTEDLRAWAAAALVSGGVAWLDGLRLSRRLGPLDGRMSLRPNVGRLGLEFAWRESPFSASAQLGSSGDGIYGLQFRRAF